ncbi:MAG: hypothetical protein WC279_03150 [Sulfurimonas sp.]|uniref:hypothetical protein n=1 Tax=Sulfurimonas sp. TaxID=2022749 RepID=UPI003568DC58
MKENISLNLIQGIADLQKDLIAIFQNNEIIFINSAFEKFFSVSSLERYKAEFGPFVNNFVPHPHYFNAEKISDNQNWFDAILELAPIDRIVSMMTQNYEPRAFSVEINKIEEYIVALFCDITQTLIKRIMIENKTNIDAKSGAYAKNYFLQVAQSYQDAALFNEKIISAISIHCSNIKDNTDMLKESVAHFKSVIRQDDMLIRWSDDTFLLIYMIDNIKNAQIMLDKLNSANKPKELMDVEYNFMLTTQNDSENINSLLRKIK